MTIRRGVFEQSLYIQKYNLTDYSLVDSVLITDAIPTATSSEMSKPAMFQHNNGIYLVHNIESRRKADFILINEFRLGNSKVVTQKLQGLYQFNNFKFAVYSASNQIYCSATYEQLNPLGDNSKVLAAICKIYMTPYSTATINEKFKLLLGI